VEFHLLFHLVRVSLHQSLLILSHVGNECCANHHHFKRTLLFLPICFRLWHTTDPEQQEAQSHYLLEVGFIFQICKNIFRLKNLLVNVRKPPEALVRLCHELGHLFFMNKINVAKLLVPVKEFLVEGIQNQIKCAVANLGACIFWVPFILWIVLTSVHTAVGSFADHPELTDVPRHVPRIADSSPSHKLFSLLVYILDEIVEHASLEPGVLLDELEYVLFV